MITIILKPNQNSKHTRRDGTFTHDMVDLCDYPSQAVYGSVHIDLFSTGPDENDTWEKLNRGETVTVTITEQGKGD